MNKIIEREKLFNGLEWQKITTISSPVWVLKDLDMGIIIYLYIDNTFMFLWEYTTWKVHYGR